MIILGKVGVGSQTAGAADCECGPQHILLRDEPVFGFERARMVQTRIKPYFEEMDEKVQRAEQLRVYRRNQAFGLLLIGAAILVWWLFHTNPRWIFPPGWWRP